MAQTTQITRSVGSRSRFPVGLYATMLLALCWLLLPEALRPVERFLLGVACLPQRLVQHAGGVPAHAGSRERTEQLLELRRGLMQRSRQHDVDRARALMPEAMEPLLCRVRDVDRRGGGAVPCELLLDRSYKDLAGCADIVTCGDVLLGFLARPGIGPAEDDVPEDPARVLLLNHPQSRSVAVQLPLPDGGALHCVVAAAAVVDPAPLRTVLHDDPYRAASMRQGGMAARTLRLDAAWVGAVPADLLVGHVRIWGYDVGGDTLTIGLYVEPPTDPRALPQVVVWQAVPGSAPASMGLRTARAVATALPDGAGGRSLVTAESPLPDGAAVVQDAVLLGTLRGVAFGQGLCTSFAQSRHPWSLWLLPDDPRSPPRGLFGEVAFAHGNGAWFRPRDPAQPLVPGFVFTGANGPNCPPGLLIGRAEPDLVRRLLRIAVPERRPSRDVDVVVAEEFGR